MTKWQFFCPVFSFKETKQNKTKRKKSSQIDAFIHWMARYHSSFIHSIWQIKNQLAIFICRLLIFCNVQKKEERKKPNKLNFSRIDYFLFFTSAWTNIGRLKCIQCVAIDQTIQTHHHHQHHVQKTQALQCFRWFMFVLLNHFELIRTEINSHSSRV